MTDMYHYTKAEELLTRFDNMTPIDKGRYGYVLTQAQIHATLATVKQGKQEYVIDFSENKVDMEEFEEIFSKYLTRRS